MTLIQITELLTIWLFTQIAAAAVKAEVAPRLDGIADSILRWTNRRVGGTAEQREIRMEEMHDHLNQMTRAPLTRAFFALRQQAIPAWSHTTIIRRIRWLNFSILYGSFIPNLALSVVVNPFSSSIRYTRLLLLVEVIDVVLIIVGLSVYAWLNRRSYSRAIRNCMTHGITGRRRFSVLAVTFSRTMFVPPSKV